MYHITFTATPQTAKCLQSKPGIDVNHYHVQYDPLMGGHLALNGLNTLEGLLVETICSLREYHQDRSKAIDVTLKGDFPQKYSDEIRELFELYAKAEKVEVKVGFSQE